jgi:hypothetical protein
VSLVSIKVWRLSGDTLNIICNFLYCNHQVHRYILITLYIQCHKIRKSQTQKLRVVSSDVVRKHHITRNNRPFHNILSTAPQLSISLKALGTLPEDGNVMPKHVAATIHN